MKWIAEGVFEGGWPDSAQIDRLIVEARGAAKRRARICFHEQRDNVHQMLIVLMRDTVVEPHSHEGVESQFLLEGHGGMDVGGNVLAFDSLHPFYFIRAGVVHRPIVETEYMVVLETKG